MALKGPSILQALLLAFSGAGLAMFGCMGAMSAGNTGGSNANWVRAIFGGVSLSGAGGIIAVGYMVRALAHYFGSDQAEAMSDTTVAAPKRQPPLLPVLGGIAGGAAVAFSCFVGMAASSPVASSYMWSRLGMLAGLGAFAIGTLTLGFFIVGGIGESIRKRPKTDRESGG